MFVSLNSSKPTAPQPTNHVFIVDVSGSMYDTLPKLRKDLKNKIAALIGPDDTMTIIYFSGRDTAGFVFTDKHMKSAADLTDVHNGIDRWLQPIGLTAFCKPLHLAVGCVRPGMFNSMVFLTDGYNNDCSISDVMAALDTVKVKFDATYFIEYGYYCDSKLIGKMAETTGGAALNADGFNELTIAVENSLRGIASPKVNLTADGEWLISYSNGNLILNRPDVAGTVWVAGETEWFCTGEYSGTGSYLEALAYAWALFSFGDIEQCERILLELGDVGLIESFSKAYGKQKGKEFKELVLATINGTRALFADGEDKTITIDPNAYTVMDMLTDLSSGDNLIYLNHPAFSYTRISAKRVELPGVADPALLNELTDVVGAETAQEILGESKPKFEASDPNAGVSFNTISYNSSRANVNFTVTTPGTVVNLPINEWKLTEWPSQIIRSYNVVKDGILNVTKFAVSLDEPTYIKLASHGLVVFQGEERNGNKVYILDFSNLPVINRSMVKTLSAQDTANQYVELLAQKAAAKVFKYYAKDDTVPEAGSEEAKLQWLESIGIKSYGWNPSTVKGESTDFYYAPELDGKVAGASSLPSVEAAIKKRTEGKKLNVADQMILKYVDLHENISVNAGGGELVDTKLAKKAVERKRQLELALSKTIMSLVMGRRWFADKTDYEDNVVTVNHPDFGELTVTLAYNDVEVKI